MIIQYIEATYKNLEEGSIVIMTNVKGHVYGSLMICISNNKEIENTGKAFCYKHNSKGFCKIKQIPISNLSKAISRGLNDKSKK